VAAEKEVSSNRGLLSIGQVCAKLLPEFPDLAQSKLRFLEDEGLVTPARTESGYRKYSMDDLNRVRLILTMQRDLYLPLKVIGTHLSAIESGDTSALPLAVGIAEGVTIGSKPRRTRDELVAAAGCTINLLQDAISAGFIVPADSYGDESLTTLSSLAELQRAGIEPRHMRTLKAAAEREFALIERSLVGVLAKPTASSRARANEKARELAEHVDVVRAAMLRAVISQQLG
jgi:DNA-binding transcriptional MerR regulator